MLSSASRNRNAVNIWPGFVDALTTLILVFIFMLMVFLLAHFQLNSALLSRDASLEDLKNRVTELISTLAQERQQSAALRENVAALGRQINDASVQQDALQQRLAQVTDQAARAAQELANLQAAYDEALFKIEANEKTLTLRLQEIASLRHDLAALQTLRKELEDQVGRLGAALDQTQTEAGVERDRRKALEARLAEAGERTRLAQTELDARDIRLQELLTRLVGLEENLASERNLKAQAQTSSAQHEQEILSLREQTERLAQELKQAATRVDSQSQEIADLQYRLNLELIQKVQELNRYRSEFFGRLREVLGDRPDIRIAGDRFLFQSELFFDTGSASLGEEGRRQLTQVANTLSELAKRIPPDIDWILEVDGHTDRRPIKTAEFPSNWELSMARAISIVRFLMDQGIPPKRLAAAGFAEFQPIDAADGEAAYTRNRRIEFKFTNR